MAVRAPRLFFSSSALLSEIGCARRNWSSGYLPYLSSTSFSYTSSIHLFTRHGGWRLHSAIARAISEQAGGHLKMASDILEMKDTFSLTSSDGEVSEVKVLKEIQACTSMNEFVELLADSHKVKGLMRMQRKADLVKDAEEPLRMLSNQPADIRNRWFPYIDAFRSGDATLSGAEILQAIEPHLLDSRKERLRNVVNNRSYSVNLVVEGLTDFGNVSAAFRSADALGIQSVHVISRSISKRYRENRNVSMGAEKWLDVELWSANRECFRVLKSRGYRIAAACLGNDTVSILDMDWTVPTAVVVGNEHSGISEEAAELADVHCSIPVTGMVDSFNVSVASGIIMHHAVCDRRKRLGSHGDLTSEERKILLAEFYLRHSKGSISIAHEFAKRKLDHQMAKL